MKRYTSDKVFHQRFPLPRLMMFLLFLLFSPLLGGQSTLPVLGIDGNLVYPDEAPEELFSYEIGDAEIDFFLLGSWQANLGFAAGLTWLPQSGGGFEILPYPPSDFASTPLSNEVDLLVSLWIDNQFFFESSFRSGFSDNSILAGYYGEGILREAKVGNTDIGIGEYPYLPLAGGITGSPGLSAALAAPSSLHEITLRYETSSQVSRAFTGNREIRTRRIEIDGFIAGRHFLLPDRNLDFLEVYLEADRFDVTFGEASVQDASGKWYRRLAEGSDYGFDDDSGELRLSAALPIGRVIVYYEKSGNAPGTAAGEIPIYAISADGSIDAASPVIFHYNGSGGSFQTDFVNSLDAALGSVGLQEGDYQIDIDGHSTALILYEPGVFSPFEIQAYYPVETASADLRLADAAGGLTRLNTGSDPAGVQILPDSSYSVNIDPWKLRYPLLDVGARSAITGEYGPIVSGDRASGPSSFWIESGGELGSGFSISEEIIPGSLRIYRNGQLETDYVFEGGSIRFSDEPSPLDDIKISYRVLDESGQSGNIIAAQGNRFNLGDAGTLELALAGSIAVENREFSEIPGNNPGYLQLSAGWEYAGEDLTISLEAGAGLFSADTRGEFRPAASDPSDWSPAMGSSNLYPSALPEALQVDAASTPPIPASAPAIPAGDLIDASRAVPVYRNYRDSLRGFLLPRDAFSAGSEPDPVTGAAGPYPVLAAADDPVSGVLAAVEVSLAEREWTGFQYFPEGDSPGLITGFELRIFRDNVSVDDVIHIALQFGAIGEDLDGDNVLDFQQSPEDLGIPFNPDGTDFLAAYPGRTYIPGWSGYSEDADGDGLLEANQNGGIVTRYLGSLDDDTQDGSWLSAAFSRDDFSAEELRRLGERPGVRVILYSDTDVDAVLYFSRVSFSQSRIIVQGEDAFSSSGSDGWDISWNNGSEAGVILDLGSAPAGIYRILEIPMNAGSATADRFALSINDIPLASLTLPGSADHTLRIDFDLGSIEIRDSAGSVVDSAGLPSDFPVETLYFLGIEFATGESGDFFLGRPVFSQAASFLAASGNSRLDYRPQNLRIAENTPLESGISRIRLDNRVSTGGMGPVRGLNNGASIEGRLPFSDFALRSSLFWDFEREIAGSFFHSLRISPLDWMVLENRFGLALDDPNNPPRLSSSLSLSLDGSSPVTLQGEYRQEENGTIRNRNWAADLALNPGGTAEETTASRGGMTLSADLSLDEERSSGGYLASGSFRYFTAWADSIALIFGKPSQVDDTLRDGEYDLGFSIARGESWSIDGSLGLGTGYRSLPEGYLDSDISQKLDLEFKPGELMELGIRFSQDGSLKGAAASDTFGSDLAASFNRFASAPRLALPLWGYAIFAGRAAEDFFDDVEALKPASGRETASQSHELSLDFSRRSGSQAQDLLIPSFGELGFTRKLTWKQGLESDLRSAGIDLGWQAVNLSGSLGRYRRFSWYESDEFYLEASWDQNMADAGDLRFETRLYPVLFNPGRAEELALELEYAYAARGESPWQLLLSADLAWQTPLKAGGRIATFLNENSDLEADFALENRERLSMGYTGLRRDSKSGGLEIPTAPGFSIRLSHDSSLRFSELGSFSLSAALAYENRAIREINYRFSHTIGIQIDAMLELSY
jgi:hypothetical protein